MNNYVCATRRGTGEGPAGGLIWWTVGMVLAAIYFILI